jgi:succinate dehydrogenase/fumarate reductase flavoprotein subunit
LNDASYGSPFATSAEGRARFWRTSAHAWQAPSIAGLAAAAGLPPAAVTASLDRYNAWIESGLACDPDFGRDLAGLEPICEPPFYAVQYFPLVQKNLAGVRTDAAGRVRRAGGGTIGGLFAAGEVAGMAGGCINGAGAIEGTMFGPSMYSGRIAGRAAARAARSGSSEVYFKESKCVSQ